MTDEIIQVWPEQIPDADLWRNVGPELERPRWENSRLVRNVSRPTLTVSLPDPSLATGAGIVVCPGGAFHFLMVDKEGTEVARWLNERGVAAFILKYRVVSTPDDDEAFLRIAADPSAYRPQMEQVQPMAIADGLQALRIVRRQADRWGIAPDRLGIMGFSAGAFVTVGAATQYDTESRPDFAVAVYGGWRGRSVPADAPPLFLTIAGGDELIDVQTNLSLYSAWHDAGRQAELHVYAHGGHGFALIPKGLPADTWTDRCWEWLQAGGFVPNRR
jgi:acetyl esterase/lipase